MVSFLSNPLCLKSSFFQFEGPEIEGPDMVAERSEAIRSAPSSFRACTPKMKTPVSVLLFFFLQRKPRFLHRRERRMEPLARAPHSGLTLAGTRAGPRPLEALRKPLARLTRSWGTERTLATRPAASAASVLPTAWAAPGGPGRTDGCH